MSSTERTTHSNTERTQIDEIAAQLLQERIIADAGGAMAIPLVLLGDRLGLFDALAGSEPATASELAERTGLAERYVREWLLVMAASEYITYQDDAERTSATTARYYLTPEQAAFFTDTDSAYYMIGAFQTFSSAPRTFDRLVEAFRTGEGIGWHEHDDDTYIGNERFFRPAYKAHLVSSWIPALNGLQERLVAGVRAADVGCGLGASTIIMAQTYPATEWIGIDSHPRSIELARSRAADAGVSDLIDFQEAGATELSGPYDFVTFLDCLHDMPDPLGALRAARAALTRDGHVMLVEPKSSDVITDGFHPLGRMMVAASVFVCLPSGLSAAPATGLGNQAGPTRTLLLAHEAGFGTAQIALSTPFNLVYELRP
ncbi:class I SAM-dependent methyltransferase [Pseudonocardia alaniniphila]|uniref:Methyltransferase domain-containing protein n=1 Tax=Pseudonocardia alaniniphila TaxID=75291 RepID=A0ABS9TGV8_9PSEU|nr:methyltransferase domain-containing protein [Pseudonocardia alaniniphila]MCH6167775.1 methyltransferase domain-containing protein [Pseudonocardia alaniniphila]